LLAGERLKKWLDSMPLAKRQKFLQNMERWERLPPEARERIRERFRQMHQRAKRDADEAYREMGLDLSSEQKAAFIQRYLEERRLIEEKLRREIEAKRKDEVTSLKKRLHREFGGGNPDAGAPRDAVRRERPDGQADERRPGNQSLKPPLPEI
jgi:TRAP-type C4-dicarboxylate transport system substrate-binding protein